MNVYTAEFVCECGRASCVERIRMRLSDYEQVRSDHAHWDRLKRAMRQAA